MNEQKENTELKELFEAGAHYGYSNARRHPSMKGVIFGSKNNTEIIDLEKTQSALETALDFVRTLGKEGKQILFVGSKAEAAQATADSALALGMPYVVERWIGGTLTNFSEIKKRIARLSKLEEEESKGELSVYTKKEQLLFSREKEKLEKYFGGIRNLKDKTDAICIIDPRHEAIAAVEAQKRDLPIIALLNVDCDARKITFPIPGNDASIKTIKLILEKVRNAYQEGKKESQ